MIEVNKEDCTYTDSFLFCQISVTRVSPGNTWSKKRPCTDCTKVGSPPQHNWIIALVAYPKVHKPCKMGRGNLAIKNIKVRRDFSYCLVMLLMSVLTCCI